MNFRNTSRKNYLSILVVLLIGVLLLNACGNKEPEVPQKDTSVADPVAQEDPTKASPEIIDAEEDPTEEPADNAEETATQKQWNGFWYGSFFVSDTYGEAYEGAEGFLDDYYVYFDVDEDGFGSVNGNSTPFDPSQEYEAEFSMWIDADENHFEQVLDEAWFLDMDIIEGENGKDFWFAPTPDNKNAVVMVGRYVDPEEEGDQGFEFVITIFRWGEEWDEEVSNLTPPSYETFLAAFKSDKLPVDLMLEDDEDAIDETPVEEGNTPQTSGPKFSNKFESERVIVYYPDGAKLEETMLGDPKIIFEDLGFQFTPREGLDDYAAILENYENSKATYPDLVAETLTIDGYEATLFKYVDDLLGPSFDLFIKLDDTDDGVYTLMFTTLDYSGELEDLEKIDEIYQIIEQIEILD